MGRLSSNEPPHARLSLCSMGHRLRRSPLLGFDDEIEHLRLWDFSQNARHCGRGLEAGEDLSPLQTNKSERAAGRLWSLPRHEGLSGPHARAQLCFHSPPSSTSSLQREISFARRGERPSLMEEARLRPRSIRALRSKARSPWRVSARCTLWKIQGKRLSSCAFAFEFLLQT